MVRRMIGRSTKYCFMSRNDSLEFESVSTAFYEIRAEQRNEVALITINRPDAANALSSRTAAELSQALAMVARASALRAVVLTGSGDQVFCAGADLKERRANPGMDRQLRRPLLAFWRDVWMLEKPVVMAVNGHAAGGGFELLMLADAVVAAESAEFWLPELQWGVIPGGWGTQMLPRIAGPVRARWLALSGERLSAREVMALGIVTHCVPQAEVGRHALEIAGRLAAKPPAAMAAAKEALRHALSTPVLTGVEIEDRLLQIAAAAPERQAALERFAKGERS
jgi:methylglutaconyl-CoA hydratase